MTYATFILSTGRCGTQWIAQTFSSIYSDLLHVEHEPLHDRYHARNLLGWRDYGNASEKLSKECLEHLDEIEQILQTQSYLECGHPVWSLVPYLAWRFHGRIRMIHLVRHPVPTSCSWLTHQAYVPPLLPYLKEKVFLSPFDEGVRFHDYQEQWDRLHPYEKCLYYWGEVNQFALDQEKSLDVPWFRLYYEDLFHGKGLESLLQFLELPSRETVFNQIDQTVDRFRYLSPVWQDWRMIKNHPQIMGVAHELGYQLEEIEEAILRQRYLMAGQDS